MDDDTGGEFVTLRALLYEGIAELDAGLGLDTTPQQVIADALVELGLDEYSRRACSPGSRSHSR